MFEERTDLLREHIVYLQEILSCELDEGEEVNPDELESFIETCQEEIDNLKADLPYDEIDDDDIPIEDFSGDNLEDSEIEDEIVEVEEVIQELQQLMESAVDRFLDKEESSGETYVGGIKIDNMSQEQFDARLRGWLSQAIRDKCSEKGITKSDEEISEMCDKLIECSGDYPTNPFPSFSVGISHITCRLIRDYKILGHLMNFDLSLKNHSDFWRNMI